MSTYNNIDAALELAIRQGFSSDLRKFKTMKGWLDGAFKQMVIHNGLTMYSFRSRIKQIESLLTKFDEKLGDEIKTDIVTFWRNIDSYKTLVESIDDFIGGRLISFFINDIPQLHDYLRNFQRFYVEEVTIHDMVDNQVLLRSILSNLEILDNDKDHILDEFDNGKKKANFNAVCNSKHKHKKNHKIQYQVRLNTNGYVGVHMVIRPITFDDYWRNEPGVFKKFELQVRSLIHEAWAEIQHEVIYKGERMPEEMKKARATHLEGISTILSGCEKALYHAAKESNKAN